MEATLHEVCPKCKQKFDMVISNKDLYPLVRSKIEPIGDILVYRISTDEMRAFLIKKSKFFKERYDQDIKIELSSRYCEVKDSSPHRSYGSLRIALSEGAVAGNNSDWYTKIGEDERKIMFTKEVFVGLVKKYQYDRKGLDDLLSNYKQLEDIENKLGATETFIEDIRYYTPPRRIKSNDGKSWIIFAARAENVIRNMLEDPNTGTVKGDIEIHDVYRISKDVLEFIVYVHQNKMKTEENPYVRQILMGDIKPKK